MELVFNQTSYTIIEMGLYIPITGCWDIPYLRVAEELEISVGNSVEVTIFNKTLKGTVADISIYGGITTLIIAASTYKLKDVYPSTHLYGGIINDVVKIILGNTGMTLSPLSDRSILNTSFNTFHSIQTTASNTLDNVLRISKNAAWKIELDGTLFIGKETYTDFATKYPSAVENDNYLIRDKYMDHYNVFTMDILFEPGFIIDGKKVKATEFILESTSGISYSSSQNNVMVTTLFHFLEPPKESLTSIGSNEDELLYLRKYSASVVEQPSNSTVSVYLDSDIQELFEGGLKDVPIIHTIPNMYVKAKAGAKCILEFLNGSPTSPAITGWFHSQSDLVSVTFADNTTGFIDSAARKGDKVSVGIISGTAPPGGGPITFTYAPHDPNFAGPPTYTIVGPAVPLNGSLITSGSSAVKIG